MGVSHGQRSLSLQAVIIILCLLVFHVGQSHSYDISLYSTGCHKFPANHSFYYQPPNAEHTVTAEQCRTDCSHFRFAAVWHGSLCSCFEEIHTVASSDAECSLTCNGDASQLCGSDMYMNVYRSEVRDERIPSSISTSDSLTLSTNPLDMTSWLTHTAQVEGDFSSLAYPTYLLEISDGSRDPVDEGIGYQGDGEPRSFTLFRSSHQYELWYTVTDSDSVSLHSTTAVQTNMKMKGVTVSCPRYAASTKEHECFITAIGNQMTLDLDFGDGILRTMSLGDTITENVGSVSDYGLSYGTSVVANEIYFLPNNVFKHAGILLGFKFHANEYDSMSATIKIYRPSCDIDFNNTYCYHTDSCVNMNHTCDGNLGTRSTMCDSSHVWSFSARKCVDQVGSEQYNNRQWAEIGGDYFEMVHEFTPNIIQIGWQSHGDDDVFEILPGDMMGIVHTTSTGSISYIDQGLGPRGYRGAITDSSKLPPSSSLTTEFNFDFLIEAYISRPVDVIVKKTYADEIDEVNVTVTLTSPEDPDNVLINSTYIDVQIEISGVYLISDYSDDTCYGSLMKGMTNLSHPFIIPPHEGELPRYTIKWGDEKYRLKTWSRYFDHVYTNAGVYNVSVYAMNEVSDQSNWTTISIQDQIQNLKLDKDYFITALDNQSTLYISIDQGTNVTYTITVFDLTGTEFVLYHDSDNQDMPGEHFDEDRSRGYTAYINYTFGAPGNWTMKVVAENCISRSEAILWFKVEVPIIGLDIIDIAPISFGNSTLVYFSIVNGTDISFWSTFDGLPTREWVMHEAGIIGHQYDDVGVLKATLIYNLMHDWIMSGRIGPVPITVADAAEFGLGEMVAKLAALGQSSLEMLAGPIDPVILNGENSTINLNDSSVLANLEEMALAQKEKAKMRCPRDLDGCSWHHGMAYIIPEDYNVTGPHELVLYAENILEEGVVNTSTTVWVEYIIENLVMQANETYVKTNDFILFNVTVSQLSRANTTISYGDPHEDMEWRYEMLENDTIEFIHAYNESGNFTVDLHSVNNISEASGSLNVTIQDPVEGVYLRTNSPVTRPWTRGGVAQFMIYWDPDAALLPTDAFIWISYGVNDHYTDEFIGFDDTLHNMTVTHEETLQSKHDWLLDLATNNATEIGYIDTDSSDEPTKLYEINAFRSLTELMYWDFGDYNISINVSNLVSHKKWDFVLVVDQNVLDLDIKSDVYNLTFGYDAKLDVTRRWGSRINLTWDYKDSHPNDTAMYNPDEPAENFKIHTFDEVGVYWVTVTAVNSVGTWTAMLPEPIMVQHPVIGFSLECSLEMVLLEHPDWATAVETHLFLDKTYPLATNATAIFMLDLGDKDLVPVVLDVNEIYKECDKSLENSTHYHIHTITHLYALGALRNLGVQIFNLVSDDVYNDTLSVYDDIHEFSFSVYSVLPQNADDFEDEALWMPGEGLRFNKFPLDELIVFDVNFYRGSFIDYIWDFGDGSSDNTYEIHLASKHYENVGTYTVRVNASNPLSKAYFEVTFEMQIGVGPVSIFTATPLTKNTTIQMTVDPGWIGTSACYFIDFGAELYKEDMHYYYFIGNEVYCTLLHFAKMADQPNFRSDYEFSERERLKLLGDGKTANLTIDFDYEITGIYEAYIEARNEVSFTKYTLYVGVTRGPCKWPEVDMKINSGCLVDTMCTEYFGMEVKQHFRSVSLEVTAAIAINCSSTKIYHHTWSLDEIDKVSGEVIRSIQPEELINSLGLNPEFYHEKSLPTVIIPKLGLTYGLYRFSLNVSMDREFGIETIDSVLIEIVKSDIKAAVVGGVSRRYGWGNNVTLDALSETYDPDFPDNKEGFSCRWMCKRQNESWPVYNDDYTEELIGFQVLNESYYYPDDIGGCFRDDVNSSGFFPIPPWGIDHDSGCIFTYDYFFAYENEKIEFKVIVAADTRRKVISTYVDITEGDPPQLDITSESQCLSNCGDKLNYAAKYTVEARVTNDRAGTVYNYAWDLFQADGLDADASPFSAHQFGHPQKSKDPTKFNDCGELEQQSEEVKAASIDYLAFCTKASTGLNRKGITIEKDLFIASDALNTFFLYVKVSRPGSTNFGETFRQFYINTPPIAGECEVQPPNGTALVTPFTVVCPTPFEDEHKPFKYEITYAGSDDTNPANVRLWKYFHKGNNPYSNKGGVLAQGDENNDYLRWLRVRCFDSIGSWTDIFVNVIIYPAPDSVIADQMELLLGEGGADLMSNPDAGANIISAMSATMNNAKSNCSVCSKDDFYDYIDEIPEGEDPAEFQEKALVHCESVYQACLHAETTQAMKARESMITNLNLFQPLTSADCEKKMATMSETSKKSSELSGDSQELIAGQAKGMVSTMANSDEPIDPVTSENFALTALGSIGSTVTATKDSQEADIADQQGLEAQSEHETELRRRRRKRSTGRTAQETQLDLLETVDSIGGIVGSSKAAGESPSMFNTPSMNLAINKAWGDQASNVPADDGNGFNLPDSGSLFPDANDTSQLVMSSKVVSQPTNPFVGKNDSSNDTLSINSAVVMLSLTNATGGALDLGNMTEPTHVFIKRDKKDVTVNTVVMPAGEFDNKEDKTPFTIHKLKLPAASSLHIRLVQTWIFNTTNCSAVNFTYADNETLAYCNWTSTLETTPQPTWLDVTTTRPTTVSTPFSTTTLADGPTTTTTRHTTTTRRTTTTTGTTTTSNIWNTTANIEDTTANIEDTTTTRRTTTTTSSAASTTEAVPVQQDDSGTTMLPFDTTESWIQDATNKTGWVLFIGKGVRISLTRPETYITCELPFLNDPIKLLQAEIKKNQVNKNNASQVLNNTEIPAWLWNLPQNLERDLDSCFYSNAFFDSPVEMDIYIGIKYIPPTNYNSSSNISDWLSATTPAPVRERRDAAAELNDTALIEELVEQVFYQLEFYTAQCKIWNHYIQDWETEGCEVGPYSSPTNTHCICTKITRDPPDGWVEPLPRIDPVSGEVVPASSAPPMSFGAALAVPTNEIDMTGAAFANLGENPLVFSFMVSLMCLYLCLCIWARSADIKDEIKSSTSPLLDNDPRDKYFYELIVYTGGVSGGGTTAKVSMILSGDEDETPPRLIFDDKKPVLTRGGTDSFIMAVPQCLGSLNVCRVWHDNSGKSPSWNFSRVQVTDLMNNEKFFFVLDRWLAVDQDDGCIDRVIPVAGKEELTNFNLVFWSKARTGITDGHIWFSVFGRPHRSRFTRIQRLTCCLSLLFCTMFANILFYQGDDAEGGDAPKSIKLGPIEFTLQMLLIGIYGSLIAFPVNLIIVTIFRYSAEKPKRLPKAVKERKKDDEQMMSQSTLELRQQAEYLNSGDDNNRLMSNLETTAVDNWGASGDKKKKKFMLPWWFVIVGYLLCLGSIGWCFYAVVSVAFGFGPKKAGEWLASFMLSFFESVLFTQPIKVLGLAAFYALVIKSPAVEDDDERDPELQKDEVYVHEHKRAKDIHNPRFRRRLKNFTRIPLPPSEEYLKAARLLRHKEVKMMTLIREMAIYLIFIYLLIMVGYGNRDPWAHYFYRNVKNMAVHGHWSPNNNGFAMSKVVDPGTFYRWLEDTLVASYYSTEVYDGERHWWTTNFSADYNSVPAGKPRLRLLRTQEGDCAMPVWLYEKRCGISYSISGQDTESYNERWVPLNYSDMELMTPDEGFAYNTSASLFGFPTSGAMATYSGGGYIYELSHVQAKTYQKIDYLKEIEWIDSRTRAVFVEFNLYNSAINMFAVSYILFEFLPTGSVIPSFKVQIFRLDRYMGSQALTVMVAEILTTIYFIFYLVREIKQIRKLKREYLKSYWNIFEIVVLSGCMLSLVIYFIRLYICLTTMKRFREDKTAFHNFQLAAGIDEIYGFFVSFILFATTIKFTKLLRFNKRIMTMAISMIAILKPLASFGMIFGIAFFAFAQMAYMIFVNNLLEFSTFATSMGTLFSMMLNKFDYPVLERANPVFAPIIFLAFVGMMTMIMVNFMLTIILDTYSEVRDELLQQENEYELVEFITGKIKGLVGKAPPPKLPKLRNEADAFVDDKQLELSSRVEELMEKFMDIVTSDPQQRNLAEQIEQKKKFLKKGVGVNRKIVTG